MLNETNLQRRLRTMTQQPIPQQQAIMPPPPPPQVGLPTPNPLGGGNHPQVPNDGIPRGFPGGPQVPQFPDQPQVPQLPPRPPVKPWTPDHPNFPGSPGAPGTPSGRPAANPWASPIPGIGQLIANYAANPNRYNDEFVSKSLGVINDDLQRRREESGNAQSELMAKRGLLGSSVESEYNLNLERDIRSEGDKRGLDLYKTVADAGAEDRARALGLATGYEQGDWSRYYGGRELEMRGDEVEAQRRRQEWLEDMGLLDYFARNGAPAGSTPGTAPTTPGAGGNFRFENGRWVPNTPRGR